MRMTRKKIFIISWLLTIVIIVFFIIQTTRTNDEKFSISIKSLVDKSGVECIEELEKSGIKLPKAYDNLEQQAEAVKLIVYGISEGRYIDGVIPYSNTNLVELTEVIVDIALKYDPRFHSIRK